MAIDEKQLRQSFQNILNDPVDGLKKLKEPVSNFDKKVNFLNKITTLFLSEGSTEIQNKWKGIINFEGFKGLVDDHGFEDSRVNYWRSPSTFKFNESSKVASLYSGDAINSNEFKSDLKDVNAYVVNLILHGLSTTDFIFQLFGEQEAEDSSNSIEGMSDQEIKDEWNTIKPKLEGATRIKIRKLIDDHYSYKGVLYNESTLKRACRLLFEGYEKRNSLKSDSTMILKILDEACRIGVGESAREFFFENNMYMSEEKVFEELLSEMRKDPDCDEYASEGVAKSCYFYLNDQEIASNGLDRNDVLFQMDKLDANTTFKDIKKYQEENNDGISLKRGFRMRYGIPIISLALQLLDRILGKEDENSPLREGMEKDTMFHELIKKKYNISRAEALKIKKFFPMTKERWMYMLRKKGKQIGKSTLNTMIHNRFVDELKKMVSMPKNL